MSVVISSVSPWTQVRGASRDKASIGARIFLSIASPRTSNALDASPSSTRSTSTYSSILDNTRPFAALDAARERQSRNLVSIPIVDVSNQRHPTNERASAPEPTTRRTAATDRSISPRALRASHAPARSASTAAASARAAAVLIVARSGLSHARRYRERELAHIGRARAIRHRRADAATSGTHDESGLVQLD